MRKALVVAVMALVGCAPLNGTPCDKPGARQCDGADIAYCEGTKWKTYACPSICDALKGSCDWRGVKAGDLCSKEAQGHGICTADGVLTVCAVSVLEPDVARFGSGPCAPCVKDQRLEDLVAPGKDGLYHCN